MKHIVLITARDCYPYKEAVLNLFNKVDSANVYDKCISSLCILNDTDKCELAEKAEKTGKDINDLIIKRTIGNLYEDAKAEWTQDPKIFWGYKKNGIPLLKRRYGDLIFYVLPCTGSKHLGKEDSKLRQQYTSFCIDLICEIEAIKRTDIYAIIHSRDTGFVSGGMEDLVVPGSELKDSAPLKDIADPGHLCLFHHIQGNAAFDIVQKVCSGIDNIEIADKEIEQLFSSIWWWNKMSKISDLNSEEKIY